MGNEGEGKTVIATEVKKDNKPTEDSVSKTEQKVGDKKVNGWQKKILGIPVWGWVVFGLVLVWSGIIVGIVVYR